MVGEKFKNCLVDCLFLKVKGQIAEGIYPVGSKLPSLRDYAERYCVSKNTVIAAYERLIGENLVEPRRGAGYFVRGIRAGPNMLVERYRPALDYAIEQTKVVDQQIETMLLRSSIGEGLPPSTWLESCRLDRYMQKIGRSGLGVFFRSGDPFGYMPLRQHIAQKMDSYGIKADPGQILLTNGAYQAVDIIIRTFIQPGDTVLVEEPGYYSTFDKLRLQGVHIIGVPRRIYGPDIDFIERVQRSTTVRFFFMQSLGHNPTGTDISPQIARDLQRISTQTDLIIVDDDALADYKPPNGIRVSALDQLEHSIYVGSFSKSLASHVRVGFLACNPTMAEALVRTKVVVSLNSSQYAERTVDAVIEEGKFWWHVRELQKKTGRATATCLALLKQIDAEIFFEPEQSLFLWVRLPGVEDTLDLARFFYERKYTFAPGVIFSPSTQTKSPWFRCNTAYMTDQALTLLREYQGTRNKPVSPARC